MSGNFFIFIYLLKINYAPFVNKYFGVKGK